MRDHESSIRWNVALIDPDGFLEGMKRKRAGKKLFPHIGLGYLAASLEKNGDNVSVLDTGVASQREIQRFMSQPYHVVGITATSFTYREAVQVAQEIKRRYPSVPIFLGGPHTSIDPEGCLADPAIDFGIRGEGEVAFVDFIEMLKHTGGVTRELFEQIPGVVFRHQGSVCINPSAARIRELDQLPYPAWHLFPMARYRQHVLLSSRGCPMDCAFCAIRTIWGAQWIQRNPVDVVSEMAWAIQHWGKKLVHINDDNLTMKAAHVETFCNEIMRRKLKVQWVAQGVRADAAKLDILKKMRRAGCHRVSLGIESIDQAVLDAVGKNETREDMAQAVALCKRAGIQVLGMFMIGNQNDTLQTVRDSMLFAKEEKIDLPAFYMALPYPGTRLWDFVKTHGRLMNEDYLSFDHMSTEPVFETSTFSLAERRTVYRETEQFCRRQLVKYHLFFWWLPNLIKRNGYEIKSEIIVYLKAVFAPVRLLRILFRRWSPGGTK